MKFKSTKVFVSYLFEDVAKSTKSIIDVLKGKIVDGTLLVDEELMEKLNSSSKEELLAAGEWFYKSSPGKLKYEEGILRDYHGSGSINNYIKKLWRQKFGDDIPQELREEKSSLMKASSLLRRNRRNREF